jgi:hypothetical protein
MATKPKKFPFTILRDDNTYLTYDMTRKEFDDVCKCLDAEVPYVRIDAGIISLKDVRHIVEYVEPEEIEAKPEEVPVSPEEMEAYREYLRLHEEEESNPWLN